MRERESKLCEHHSTYTCILWFQVQAVASFVCFGSCGDCLHISAHSVVSHSQEVYGVCILVMSVCMYYHTFFCFAIQLILDPVMNL